MNEILEKLKVFDKFKFFNYGHYYECEGKRIGISSTGLIHNYSQKFEANKMAEKVAIKNNKTTAEVLEEWRIENKFSTTKGTILHEMAQSLWCGRDYIVDYDSLDSDVDKNRLKLAIEKTIPQISQFWLDYKDTLEIVAEELIIGSEEFNIAGAVDMLLMNKLTGELVMIDFKTNKEIKRTGFRGQKMQVPLQKLNDCNFIHYSLQLHLYKLLIEKYSGLKISEHFIVYFSERAENYEIIETLNVQKEIKKILEMRRVKKMGKSIPVLVIGKSGSGKSASLRNFKKEDISFVNPLSKRLPFKNDWKGYETNNYELIKKFIAETPKKIVVIDDSNYLLTIAMMNKAKEAGYGKFTDIALEYWKLIEFVKNLDGDKRVYFMSHEEYDEFGNIKVKTVGKMLDNQCCIEGLYTIVLRATNENGKFVFKTKTAGNDIVKTPMGMIEESEIDNDLKMVDDLICEYYNIEKDNENIKEEK